jgi:hypothetical protein
VRETMARKGNHSRGKRRGSGVEGSLVERYRTILVDRLTAEDLKELQFYLRNQFDEKRNLNREYKEKFEGKLRQFLHEEVLTREIIGIESLIRDLRPSDLKK